MKIALVVERFRPAAGGVENVAWSVAHGLAATGDEVVVLAREADPAAAVAVERLRISRTWQPLRVLSFSHAAARASARLRPDVVHSFARTLHQDVYRAGGGSHADYLARRHGSAGSLLRRFSPRHATLLWIESRIFADSSQLVQCNSEMVRREIRRRYRVSDERLLVIPNPVDLERFHPGRKLPLEAEGPVWLFVGAGFPRKGLDTAIRALAAASASSAQLWVVGRDEAAPWRALAQRLRVADRVRFLGARADLETLYASAAALLLPTRYDAFSNVCLEAAASGIPLVTSGANGAAELIRPFEEAAAGALPGPAGREEAGFVVEDPEDVSGFAKALDALASPELRARLGRAARVVAERHSLSAHVAALHHLYARVRR
ncbi:MAG TPA: glycosyltransferase family 4 protein [Myxococcota bacterium]|nr:glycosyltransferase family 4 protein [Myxococcota bacterium]